MTICLKNTFVLFLFINSPCVISSTEKLAVSNEQLAVPSRQKLVQQQSQSLDKHITLTLEQHLKFLR